MAQILPEREGYEYPMLGYEYNAAGKYERPRVIKNRGQLLQFINDVVRPAIKENREIRITNQSDEMLFHCRGGKIVFDGKTVVVETKL